MNKELLRMQKLAGLITESELREKLSLKENKIFNRTFKQNPVNIPGVDPKVAAILDANIPDEVAGSFDDANMQFVAPFDSEELIIADGPDLLDAIGSPESGLTPKDLPTEYVEIPPASFEDIDYKGFRGNPYLLPTDGSLDDNTGRNLEARTFAKYVPGKGLMYKFTTKEV